MSVTEQDMKSIVLATAQVKNTNATNAEAKNILYPKKENEDIVRVISVKEPVKDPVTNVIN